MPDEDLEKRIAVLEEALRVETEKNQTLITQIGEMQEHQRFILAAPVGFVLIDSEYTILNINDAAALGIQLKPKDMISNIFDNYIHPDDIEKLHQRYSKALSEENPKASMYEFRALKKDRSIIPLEAYSFVVTLNKKRVIATFLRDLTYHYKTQEQLQHLNELLIQSKKREALGTLAGGIAHDFNNVLMGVQGNASLINMLSRPKVIEEYRLRLESYVKNASIDPSAKPLFEQLITDLEKVHEHSINIEGLVNQANRYTKLLLDYQRGSTGNYRLIDINQVIAESTKHFPITRSDIIFKTELEEGLYPVEGNSTEIGRVVQNLYSNAIKAMKKGGELTIQTRNTSIGDQPYIFICVEDTGVGMDENIKEKVFDPWFSKGGTGLGLATCAKLIADHGGYMDVKSKVGEGSTFYVFLPAKLK